ncbi:hypothetical protein AA16373_0863 [Komagataeibacter swingsii DSM 16373]|nr:hypothetical protein AA16373_0863 [Komagataeibacter swingsii DSM 16373]
MLRDDLTAVRCPDLFYMQPVVFWWHALVLLMPATLAWPACLEKRNPDWF